MVEVKKEGVLLQRTTHSFENEGVLNPGTIRDGAFVHLFYRAVREGNFSSIGYCRLNGPSTIEERFDRPILSPEFDYESHGMEDPRIVKIDDTYYLSYTAYNGTNALGALAISKDLIHFEKKGIIVPQITYDEFNSVSETSGVNNAVYQYYNDHDRILQGGIEQVFLWDKNLVFFPRRINGKLYFLHRIKPDIQIIVSVTDVKELTPGFWNHYFKTLSDNIVLSPKYPHETSYVGGGCPPIETKLGWLIIYHGVHNTQNGYVYSACAALVDLQDPQKEIARLPYPLFKPEYTWELKGDVNNVCFPTGAVVFDDMLYIYYGAADKRIACASVSLRGLLNELVHNMKANEK